MKWKLKMCHCFLWKCFASRPFIHVVLLSSSLQFFMQIVDEVSKFSVDKRSIQQIPKRPNKKKIVKCFFSGQIKQLINTNYGDKKKTKPTGSVKRLLPLWVMRANVRCDLSLYVCSTITFVLMSSHCSLIDAVHGQFGCHFNFIILFPVVLSFFLDLPFGKREVSTNS